MIEHQFLMTNLQGNVQQVEGRSNNQSLGAKMFIIIFLTLNNELMGKQI